MIFLFSREINSFDKLRVKDKKIYDDYLDGLSKQILEETGTKFVFGNKTFRDKYNEYIKYKIELVNIKLSNPGDMEAH